MGRCNAASRPFTVGDIASLLRSKSTRKTRRRTLSTSCWLLHRRRYSQTAILSLQRATLPRHTLHRPCQCLHSSPQGTTLSRHPYGQRLHPIPPPPTPVIPPRPAVTSSLRS